MPNCRSHRNRRRDLPLGGILAAVALFAALAVVVIMAIGRNNEYRALSAITPTPSATLRSVSATWDPSAATPVPTEELVKQGSTGDSVTALQKRLAELGFYQGGIDGQFGAGTKAAVIRFQSQHGLDADGVVGDKTRAILDSKAAQTCAPTPAPTDTPTPAPMPVVNSVNLPLLVNGEHPLSADYIPGDLVALADVLPDYIIVKYDGTQAVREAAEALRKLIDAARADGEETWQISSAYRSYADQKSIFDQKYESFIAQGSSKKDAMSSTRVTVADPGASEHQTGLAFDITVPGKTFEDTSQSQWLAEHCWEYGFILRYTDDKYDITGIWGEPWHIRYVGTEHSLAIRDAGICLEEYIALGV